MAETKAQIAAHRDLLDEILNESFTVDWDGIEMTLTYRELRAWVHEGQKFSVKLDRDGSFPPCDEPVSEDVLSERRAMGL